MKKKITLIFLLFITTSFIQKQKLFSQVNHPPIIPHYAKIGILSKYKLKSFQIKIKNAVIKIGSLKYKIKNRRISISTKKNKIILKNFFYTKNKNLIIYKNKKILIASKSIFTIIFFNENKIQKYKYTGLLKVSVKRKHFQLIIHIPFEKYIHSTALAELGPLLNNKENLNSNKVNLQWKKTLISTMEVAVRSYYMTHKNRHKKEGFHLCDLTHCMHFKGLLNNETSYTKNILWKNKQKQIIKTYFHSTCGGILNHPSNVWSDWNSKLFKHNYRIGIDSSDGHLIHCRNSPHFNWKNQIKKTTIAKLLKEKNILNIIPVLKNKRISQLKYINDLGEIKKIKIGIFLSLIGRNLGWNKIKSNLFIVKQQKNHFIFIGHGFGHGIGLCQYGAKQMAIEGYSYKEILQFYYPK